MSHLKTSPALLPTEPSYPRPADFRTGLDITTERTPELNFGEVELVRNLMAHAQKPHFVFRLNGRVHLNRRGGQFSRLLAAEVRASALVMLDTPRCEVV